MPDRSWHRPEPLTAEHDLSGFSCGTPELDHWLLKRAVANQVSGSTKTQVVVEDGRVIGYFALASGAVSHREVTGRTRRNMPDPIPVVVLARLAVDEKHGGRGLGSALLQAAIETTVAAAQTIGIVGLLVHAQDEEARQFYLRFDFEPSPTDPLHLVLRLADIPGQH